MGLTLANGNVANGGAIFLESGSLSLDQFVFTNNTSGSGLGPGGALYVNNGTLTITNSTPAFT